ncbi:unnamed protein product [Prunus brigantina]
MLTQPIIRGLIGKWTMALSEFTFQYVAQKSVKGEALADFLAHHPAQGQEEELEVEIGMARMEKNYWTMYFDGSSTETRSGAGVVIESPQGQRWQFAFQLDFKCTNNQAKYEAFIIGLEILKEMKATRVLVYGDSQLNELHLKGSDGLLLLCPSAEDIKVIMTESHKGICGAHQSGVKMRWLVRRHGYYWPTILKNCIEYAKGCIKCQIYGPIQRGPAEALHPVTKPWPFRGWAVDIIDKIHPAASNQHTWILVATDYFTKWVEAESYRSISSTQVVRFFENHIVHRFGIPETIKADNDPIFASTETQEYAERIGIKLVHSTPYYPQSNGQAEASN